MDLRLPITTINGEPIEDVGRALPAIVDSLHEFTHAISSGEQPGRLVLAPCIQRALVPIWTDLRHADGIDPPELSPEASLRTLVNAVGVLVDQLIDAVDHNWSRSAA